MMFLGMHCCSLGERGVYLHGSPLFWGDCKLLDPWID